MFLIQQRCHVGDAVVVVPGCVARELQVGLGIPHVGSVVAVMREHRVVSGRFSAFYCKA